MMFSKKTMWLAFALMVLLQIWVPASVIFSKEDVIESGVAFKFKTAPVDPNDYLRGKYIMLNFDQDKFPFVPGQNWQAGETIYVNIAKDSAGYASIHSISNTTASARDPFIKATVKYVGFGIQKEVFIEWPFERFYMEESKAPLAEAAYNKSASDSASVTYALVKIKKGDAVLENVFINEQPIDVYIRK